MSVGNLQPAVLLIPRGRILLFLCSIQCFFSSHFPSFIAPVWQWWDPTGVNGTWAVGEVLETPPIPLARHTPKESSTRPVGQPKESNIITQIILYLSIVTAGVITYQIGSKLSDIPHCFFSFQCPFLMADTCSQFCLCYKSISLDICMCGNPQDKVVEPGFKMLSVWILLECVKKTLCPLIKPGTVGYLNDQQ